MGDLPCNALGKLWKKKDSDWKKMYASSTEQRDRQNSRPAHVQIKTNVISRGLRIRRSELLNPGQSRGTGRTAGLHNAHAQIITGKIATCDK